jgi:hypothetical protein
MRNVLIFGGLAIVGYALYNKFYKKDKSNLGLGGALSMQTNTPNLEIPNAQTGVVLMGDIDKTKPNVIDSAVVPKKGKFTPNRPIGRPNKSSILPYGTTTLVAVKDCECKQAPCNC